MLALALSQTALAETKADPDAGGATARQSAALIGMQAEFTARMAAATAAVNGIAAQVVAATLDPIKTASMRPALDAALDANPHILEIGVLTCDEWLRGEQRTAQGVVHREEDFADRHALVRTIFDPDLDRDTPKAYWSDAAFTSIGGTVITVRQRLLYHGAPRGLLIATVDIGSILQSGEQAAPHAHAFVRVDDKVVGKPASPAFKIDSTLQDVRGGGIQSLRSGKTMLLLTQLLDPCCGKSVQLGIQTDSAE